MGKPVHLVQLTGHDDGDAKRRLAFDLDAAKAVLLHPSVAEKPVAVLSIAGAFRKGKSFILNFLLRYATASEKAQADGSWLGSDMDPLGGFSWRHGEQPDTSGVLIWGDPLVVRLGGVPTALVLLDSQGTFDDETKDSESAAIFAFSALLSSLLLYNLSLQIAENDLQYLEFVLSFAQSAVNETKDAAETPLQHLLFLIRDWRSGSNLGFSAGHEYLEKKLSTRESQPKELKKLRANLRSFYEKLSCCLLPYPGEVVAENAEFNGGLSDIKPTFVKEMTEMVRHIFSSLLQPKRLNGEFITSSDLFKQISGFASIFESGRLPEGVTILQATAQVAAESALNVVKATAQCKLEQALAQKKEKPFIGLKTLDNMFAPIKEGATREFRSRAQLGGPELWERTEARLDADLAALLDRLRVSEERRRGEARNAAAARLPPILAAFRVALEGDLKDQRNSLSFYKPIGEQLLERSLQQYTKNTPHDEEGDWEQERLNLKAQLEEAYAEMASGSAKGQLAALRRYVGAFREEKLGKRLADFGGLDLERRHTRLKDDALAQFRGAKLPYSAKAEEVWRSREALLSASIGAKYGALQTAFRVARQHFPSCGPASSLDDLYANVRK